MEELIKINTNESGASVVSARDLYQKLGYDLSQWSRWYKKNIVNNSFAIVNEDWVGFDIKSSGNDTKDFALSLDFAKRLSMMAKTKVGDDYRKYFIQCENIVKSNVKVFTVPSYQIENPIERAKAWIIEKEQVLMLEAKNEKLQYRSDFVDICFDADGVFKFDEVAKILKLDFGSVTLYNKMREAGLIMKGTTIPYQKYVNNGYFKVVEELIENGKFKKLIATTFATQKGLGYIKKLLDKQNGK